MMITEHIAAGLLISTAIKSSPKSKYIFVCVIASLLPDITVLFLGKPGDISYLSHRLYTHSLLLMPVYAILPAMITGLIYGFCNKNTFFQIYSIGLLAYLSHIFLDLITPFGVQILYPLSNRVYSLDFFHSFDPIMIALSLILIASLIFQSIGKKKIRDKLIIAYFISTLIYLVFTGLNKSFHRIQYSQQIDESSQNARYLATVPRTFWRWKGIGESLSSNYTIIIESGEYRKREYTKIQQLPLSIKESSAYNQFISYARFPIVEQHGSTFKFFNLIYSPKSYQLNYSVDSKQMVMDTYITDFSFSDQHE